MDVREEVRTEAASAATRRAAFKSSAAELFEPPATTGVRKSPVARWLAFDRALAGAIHGAAERRAALRLLVAVSWLSDGIIWYGAVLLLPWFDPANGTPCALRMGALGLVDLAVYRIMKRHFARSRPFVDCPGVQARARHLDEYSFPSGHVLHATAFATLLCAYYPMLAWVLWPFAVLVAASRIVLGLHYPTDVVAGALIGWFMATCMLVLF